MRRTLFRYRSFNTEKLNDYSYIHQRIINIERKAGLLCLIDCDKFKSINDTYGHAVGDKVIIAIAETLQKLCHDKNVAFRLGGDEFAIFMPGIVEQKAAEKLFEILFENIRRIDIEEMQGKSIEISMGTCFYEGTEEVSFDQLYKNADSVMYHSKEKMCIRDRCGSIRLSGKFPGGDKGAAHPQKPRRECRKSVYLPCGGTGTGKTRSAAQKCRIDRGKGRKCL